MGADVSTGWALGHLVQRPDGPNAAFSRIQITGKGPQARRSPRQISSIGSKRSRSYKTKILRKNPLWEGHDKAPRTSSF